MKLNRITERVSYANGHTNIGVIRSGEKSVILIDTGLNADAGKKILRLLAYEGLSVMAVVNTHSHADHCGGNSFIRKQTGAPVYAPEIESAIIAYPILEPLYLYSGADPPGGLKNQFLMAPSSEVDHVIRKGESKLRLGDAELGIVPMPGHSINQIGIKIDNVLFCADSVFSIGILEKHKIPFHMSVQKAKETLRYLANSNFKFYVPSHAEGAERIAEPALANLKAIEDTEGRILGILEGKKTKDQVFIELCGQLGIAVADLQQYYLMNTVVLAYLCYLEEQGKISCKVEGNCLYWTSV